MSNITQKKTKQFPTEIKFRIISFLRVAWMFDKKKKRKFFQIGHSLRMCVNEMCHILLYTDMTNEIVYYVTNKIHVKRIQKTLIDYAMESRYIIYHRLFMRCFRMSLYFVKRLHNCNLTSGTLIVLQNRVHDILKHANV